MHVLLAIALKSIFVAGLSLGLLQLMRRRSAAERSWVAHVGLVALVLLAFAPLVLPRWTVETPSFLGRQQVEARVADKGVAVAPAARGKAGVSTQSASAPSIRAGTPSRMSITTANAAVAVYAVPAAILLFVTLLAIARLIALRARADVLIDGHWLSALARAQRRMGFKHGTALLTSEELASPISWGLMRPVILLNNRAVEAAGDAEAIIAHELAHVARMDWVKLLLARVAICLFWFNPLVWMLAREAHQLREETADDAVLAADIPDTDYAQLLVGVARHECPGLLLGAHGVAPSRNSLARRVARVLDGRSVRGPAAKSFALGVFVGSVMVAAPLAALTLAPGGTSQSSKPASKAASSYYYSDSSEVPADLPSIIADGVSTSVQAAVQAVAPVAAIAPVEPADAVEVALDRAEAQRERAIELQMARAERIREAHNRSNPIDAAIEMKAVGVTPEYVAAMRAAAPGLRDLDASEFVGMKAVGVTPEYARAMSAAGLGNLDSDELTGARAVGVDPAYVRALAALGVRGTLDDYVGMRAVGVTPAFVQELRQAGFTIHDPDKLVELRATDVTPNQVRRVRALPPVAPHPPTPPRPGFDPFDDSNDPDG